MSATPDTAITEARDALANARLALTAAKKRPYYNPRDDPRGRRKLQAERDCEAFLAPAPIEFAMADLFMAICVLELVEAAGEAGCKKTIRGLVKTNADTPAVEALTLALIETAPGDRYTDMTHRRARASFSPAQETGRQAIQWALRYGRHLLAEAAGREVA
jgi:hypothetical protein